LPFSCRKRAAKTVKIGCAEHTKEHLPALHAIFINQQRMAQNAANLYNGLALFSFAWGCVFITWGLSLGAAGMGTLASGVVALVFAVLIYRQGQKMTRAK
jgi:Flp pilus assembly protein TadB